MNERDQGLNIVIRSTVTGLLVVTAWLSGCDQRQPGADVNKEAPTGSAMSEPVVIGEVKAEKSASVTDTALMAPVASPGRAANDEGVTHAQQGHWDVAETHFQKALEADPNLAEAYFNLGLALNSSGKHDEAKAAFKKAADSAPSDARITESEILKRHISG